MTGINPFNPNRRARLVDAADLLGLGCCLLVAVIVASFALCELLSG